VLDFLVISCVDRLAGGGGHTIAAEMIEVKISGLHEGEVRESKGKPETVSFKVAAVAFANKVARSVWALLKGWRISHDFPSLLARPLFSR
jgi:hypothetical protein